MGAAMTIQDRDQDRFGPMLDLHARDVRMTLLALVRLGCTEDRAAEIIRSAVENGISVNPSTRAWQTEIRVATEDGIADALAAMARDDE